MHMHIIECVVENIASLLLVQPTDEQYFQYMFGFIYFMIKKSCL